MKFTTRQYLAAMTLVFIPILVAAAVYQYSYMELKKGLLANGKVMGERMSERLHSNISFVREDMKLFIVSKGLSEINQAQSFGSVVSKALLTRRFITFFESNYGYLLYDSIFITDKEGQVVVSTEDVAKNVSGELWWQNARLYGQSYSFGESENALKQLRIAVSIEEADGTFLGVMRASCLMSTLVRVGGGSSGSLNASRIDVVTLDGKLLYSSVLHQPGAQHEDPLLLEKIKNSKSSFEYTSLTGADELVIVSRHLHDYTTNFAWILLLHLDYEESFQPIIKLRWWIGGGAVALVCIAIYFVLLARDILSREQQEAALVTHQKLLQTILEGMEAAVLFIDKETYTITWANKVTEQLLGVSLEEVINTPCYKHICRYGDEFPEKGCPAIGKKVLHSEFKLKRKDDVVLPVTKTVLELDISGKPHFVAILFDITRRKEIEQQLAHAQKLESIGSLAAGIAHEINTPTHYIGDNLKFIGISFDKLQRFFALCKETLTSETRAEISDVETVKLIEFQDQLDLEFLTKEIPDAIVQSQQGIKHISTIVQALKRFSHPGADSMQLADINKALETTSIVCRNEWKYQAEIVYDFDNGLPLIQCMINDINQVFLNVIINASHAVSEKYKDHNAKGTIRLVTRQDSENVIIRIQDDGVGIQKDVLNRVFDPFYTTKDVGVGSGQGLSICYKIIVEKHQGSIEIKSDEGIGTECTIRLPLTDRGDA